MADTKKEAYRKYLESAGVVDALTKGASPAKSPALLQVFLTSTVLAVLVSLYEEPDKPRSAVEYVPTQSALFNSAGHVTTLNSCSYIKTVLGAPTPAEYDAVLAERDALKKQLEDTQQRVGELEGQVRYLVRPTCLPLVHLLPASLPPGPPTTPLCCL
jgi:hypothetical protein